MKTILVDDEMWSMNQFERECASLPLFEVVGKFVHPADAIAFAEKERVDFALLDIEMPEMNGLELARRLRALYPGIIVVFVTAYSTYSMDALRQKADYFVLKPYTLADVADVLERASLLSARQKKPVFIRTFGPFEVFVNNQPVAFGSAKAKELLALLVDRRGGIVSSEETIATLWEDKPYDKVSLSLCRQVAFRLRKTLENEKIDAILVEEKGGRSVNVGTFDCDLYQFLEGKEAARRSFNDEYMTQYSWAEMTLGLLYRSSYPPPDGKR